MNRQGGACITIPALNVGDPPARVDHPPSASHHARRPREWAQVVDLEVNRGELLASGQARMERSPHHGIQQGGEHSTMYRAAHVLKVLMRHQLRAYLPVGHGNTTDAQYPREGWLREPSVPYRLVHLQTSETVHHPANPLGVDPTHHSGLIIFEFVTRLGHGLALSFEFPSAEDRRQSR